MNLKIFKWYGVIIFFVLIVFTSLCLFNILEWKIDLYASLGTAFGAIILFLALFIKDKIFKNIMDVEEITRNDVRLWEQKAIRDVKDKFFSPIENKVVSFTDNIGGSTIITIELEDYFKDSPDYFYWYMFYNIKTGKSTGPLKLKDKITEQERIALFKNALSEHPIIPKEKIIRSITPQGNIYEEKTPIQEEEKEEKEEIIPEKK